MLKLRVLTAIVLIPLFISGVLWLETESFALLMAAVVALAAWEWAGISGLGAGFQKAAYTLFVILLLAAVYPLRTGPLSLWLIAPVVLCWFCTLGLLIKYQKTGDSGFRLPLPASAVGLLVLVPPWLSLLVLRADEPDGTKTVLFLLVLVWSADIVAYFCGRRWGRTRLCGRVSPGKSWEGVFAALLTAAALGLAVSLYRQMFWTDILIFTGISLVTVSASILGDLVESLMKRLGNVKDSGSILPGHGGVLDRIDSLTAALPVFACALWLWNGPV